MGNKEAQDALRQESPNASHCPWLRRDPNACESIPEGVEGIVAGSVCPHNVYTNRSEVFFNRDGVADAVERIFRLVNSAELGIVSQSDLDPFSVTELITARAELDRQSREKSKREADKRESESEAQSNQRRRPL